METRAEREFHNTVEQARWPEESQRPATLEETWFVMDSDLLEFMWTERDILSLNNELDKEKDGIKRVYVFQNRAGKGTLFKTRYEMIKYGEESQYPEAITEPTANGFIDFIGGFPLDCIEIIVFIGTESSTKNDVYEPDPNKSGKAPPKPDKLFYWPEEGRVLITKTAIRKSGAKWLIDVRNNPLHGESFLSRPHWWLRVQYMGIGNKEFSSEILVPGAPLAAPATDGPKGIIPGEFVGIGIRLMPDVPWGMQKSNPFFYSGTWIDTIYYTGARITEVIAPTDEVAYSTYKVQWRATDKYEDGIVTAKPSDFAEYKVGDRVTILKDVTTEKKSQLWKDDDTKEFGETWMIAPISFYGLDKEK